jgi:alanine racemase
MTVVSSAEYRLARPVWSEISLDAITANLREIKRLAGRPVKVIATVKAGAYGHGIVPVGLHLERLGVQGLATANLDDALALRRAGARLPIILFASNLPEGVGPLLGNDITPTIQDLSTASAISAVATRVVNVHVKVDAGLGRLGVKLSEARTLIRALTQLSNIRVEGVYTHLPFSDEAGALWSRRRLDAFTSLIEQLQRDDGLVIDYAQAAASSMLASGFPDTLNTIAPGHLLFGLSPVPKALLQTSSLVPALQTVRGRLIHIGEHIAGEDSALTSHYARNQSVRTGVILLGLDNGFRMPVEEGHVLCGGKRCRIMSVTAEYTVIDLVDTPGARVGDEVTIIGQDGSERIDLEQVGRYLGIGATLTALDLRRIPVEYTGGRIHEDQGS